MTIPAATPKAPPATRITRRFEALRRNGELGLVAFLSAGELLPVAIGFAVVAGFLMLSFHHKLTLTEPPGVTSEMSVEIEGQPKPALIGEIIGVRYA